MNEHRGKLFACRISRRNVAVGKNDIRDRGDLGFRGSIPVEIRRGVVEVKTRSAVTLIEGKNFRAGFQVVFHKHVRNPFSVSVRITFKRHSSRGCVHDQLISVFYADLVRRIVSGVKEYVADGKIFYRGTAVADGDPFVGERLVVAVDVNGGVGVRGADHIDERLFLGVADTDIQSLVVRQCRAVIAQMNILVLIRAHPELIVLGQRAVPAVRFRNGERGVVSVDEDIIADVQSGDRCRISSSAGVCGIVQEVSSLRRRNRSASKMTLGVAAIEFIGSCFLVSVILHHSIERVGFCTASDYSDVGAFEVPFVLVSRLVLRVNVTFPAVVRRFVAAHPHAVFQAAHACIVGMKFIPRML